MSPRDEARAIWKAARLSFDHLDDADLSALHETLDRHLRSSEVFEGSLRMTSIPATWKTSKAGRSARLLCHAHHFDGREAVTFHADGYAGFCGWASEGNEAPFLSAFEEWIADIRLERRTCP
jgi:hypothetical protein